MTAFFSIPKPCSENWNEMDATAQGAFCSKCTKEVIDCTTIKNSEIGSTLADKKDPCVRIFSDQIDEMNFLEWFKSLTLKIQLKYAFFFAFLTVFNSNINAQDSTRLIPENVELNVTLDDSSKHINSDTFIIENPIIELDSLTETVINEALIDSTTQTIDSSAVLEIKPNKEEELLVYPIETLEVTLGTIDYEPFLMGDYISSPLTGFATYCPPPGVPVVTHSPFLENNSEPLELIKNSNFLLLDNSRFSFYIEGNTLRFMSYAMEPESIRIKITKRGEIIPFYFNPIQIERGKNEAIFSLDGFDNGAYIVTVEGEQSAKAIELFYW
ncbi:MAG: hypothetical protein ACI8ZM_004908 [Crocinitomix sp.]|jgi:hypothetical protein